MPPKKKPRRASQGLSTPSIADPTETLQASASKADSQAPKHDVVADPWTDEEETALLKGIIRWKPVGMHKHFRMMALSQYLRSHGHNADHTRIPGIWAKLGTLYNLPILDEREDTGIGDWNPEDPEAPNWYPFVLPPEDYSSLQWAQRIADPSASSPPALEHEFSADSEDRPGSRLEIEDSQEPRSSPAVSLRGPRGGRGRARGRHKRVSKLQKEFTPQATPRRKGKAEEEPSEDEEDEEEDEEEESERGTPTVPTRGRGGRGGRGRGRGRRGRRRRGG